MANSSMDTDALLGMSLDDLIASKSSGRGSKTKTRSQGTGAGGFGGGGGGGGGGGKMRSTGRATRRQQSAPYANPVPKHARGGSNTRVYVGNLAWSVTWRELKDLMKTAGKVVKADVGVDSTGRSRGYGLVEYQTASDARAAIDILQDNDLMGRPIFVREDREAPQAMTKAVGGSFGGRTTGGNCKVFVSNLAYEVGWQDLKDHMREAGNVLRADVFMGVDGRSKGLGTVEFSKPFEARNAIAQLTDTELMGRPILIREDRGDGPSHGRGVGGGAGARVFVGNLSWQVAWQDLKDCMRQAGNVKFVDLFQEPGGRSKGCAIVEYETPQEAHTAIRELHDTELNGRMMFVREDREEGSAASKMMGPMGQRNPGAEGRQVHVSNLLWETGWQELKDHFKQVGHVQFTEIPEDAQGRSRGYGTVRFASEHSAQRAIDELNDTDLNGRRIHVRDYNH